MKEIWKDIPEYGGRYQASNLGRIRSTYGETFTNGKKYIRTGGVLKQQKHPKGYPIIRIYKDNKSSRNWRVHQLIALTFLGPSNGLHVNHKNGIKEDNRSCNLEYCTNAENIRHAVKNGLNNPPRGENSSMSILTDGEALAVVCCILAGELQDEIANYFGISQVTVSAIKHRRIWKWLG